MSKGFLFFLITFAFAVSGIDATEGEETYSGPTETHNGPTEVHNGPTETYDGPTATETNPAAITARWIDWQRGKFVIQVTVEIAASHTPKTRYKAERRIANLIPIVFIEEVADICVDSYHRIGDTYRENGETLEKLKELALTGKKESASYSADMKSVKATYTFPIFGESGLLNFFVSHSHPYPTRKAFGFVPTKRYTGIVIYAKGEYPLYGENGTEGSLKSSLFPKIFDEAMKTVVEKEQCDPESLKRWGMAQYSDSLAVERFSPRIGRFPLHIIARGIYGKNGTDIIIPTEDTKQLLALRENRDLLIQGRILIIVDNP